MSVYTVLALAVLVIGVPLNIYVTVRLWALSRESPRIAVLRERAFVALIVLVVIVVFGLIFLNNDMPALGFGPSIIDSNTTKLITRLALLALAIIPALYWFRLYRK